MTEKRVEPVVTSDDFAELARLAATVDRDELRLYLARLVRRYRGKDPNLARKIESALKSPSSGARSSRVSEEIPPDSAVPLSLLRTQQPEADKSQPILAAEVAVVLNRFVEERDRAAELTRAGLRPLSSAIFVGPPGVGKTHAARWIADQLDLPLFSLDLTAVMSSLLGRSGANLRQVLDLARATPSVLFLDEIDSIGKSRADETDIGELKRLVTILLQELDDWPSSSVLFAATNHPELVDRALWRRFDLVVNFPMPDPATARDAFERFLGDDYPLYAQTVEAYLNGPSERSFHDIKGIANSLRKDAILRVPSTVTRGMRTGLTKQEQIDLAVDLTRRGEKSQHEISRVTGLSRDTIRKYTKEWS